ncbi:MAG TPA: PIG-L family deacetylase [Acidobacteriota bacterium]|nr:PIG-L family deacetylase [Acidobacteriota bacterium]
MRVLAIGAHPDDLEILCAGTLARFAAEGHAVTMCHALNGNLGHTEIPPNDLREIRRREAKEAAALIGAESLTLDIGDLDIYPGRETRLKMVEAIRSARPDLIILPDPGDYMPDHVITSTVGFDASFMATLPQLVTRSPACATLTPVYFMDTLAGLRFDPEEYVDVSAFEQVKRRMIACHRSQAEWLQRHDGIDYVDLAMRQSSFRGLQAGVKFAEAFRPHRVWGRVFTKRFLP